MSNKKDLTLVGYNKVVESFHNETDRAAAILAASFIDCFLEKLLRCYTVLSSIKIQLSDWLMRIPDVTEEDSPSSNEDLFELKPNFHGIGVDLKALWRKWKGF